MCEIRSILNPKNMNVSLLVLSVFLAVSASTPLMAAPLGYTMSKYVEKSNCAQAKWAKEHFSSNGHHLSKRSYLASAGQSGSGHSLRQRAKGSKVSITSNSGNSGSVMAEPSSPGDASKSKPSLLTPTGTSIERSVTSHN
jgi:hypothetical protein